MVSTAVGPLSAVIAGPSAGQLAALGAGVVCFAAAAVAAGLAMRRAQGSSWPALALLGAGLAGNLVLLLWRSEQQGWEWPIRHKFDTFVLLACLVALVGLYVVSWWRWESAGAAFAPVAAVLQAAALAGLADYEPAEGPQPTGVFFAAHVVAFVLAAVSFAAAGVAGGFYLALHRRLKRPAVAMRSGRWPSLEALERLNARAVMLGFPLLTVGLYLGMVQVWDEPNRTEWLLDAKVVSVGAIWLVYAGLLHLTWSPLFRGTRMAWMSVLSFAGLLLTFVVSDLGGTRHP